MKILGKTGGNTQEQDMTGFARPMEQRRAPVVD